MNESFAIQGYSTVNQVVSQIIGEDIYQTDFMGQRKLIGKTISAYNELEETTTQYYDKLVELGVIIPPKSQEQMISDLQGTIKDMAGLIADLKKEIGEMKRHGSEPSFGNDRPDVSQRGSVRGRKTGAESTAGSAE